MKKIIITLIKTNTSLPILSMMLIPAFVFLWLSINFSVQLQDTAVNYWCVLVFSLGFLGVYSLVYQTKNSISFLNKPPPSELKTWDEIFNYYAKND